MAFWNRNKKNDLANEFREYYQPNTNERSGLAWVLALVTLVCSLFLIVSLFWGGRWVYRKIADRNKNDTKSSQTTNRPAATPAPAAGTTPTLGEGAAATPTPTSTPAPQNGVAGSSTAPTPTARPNTSLPSTGPDIDL